MLSTRVFRHNTQMGKRDEKHILAVSKKCVCKCACLRTQSPVFVFAVGGGVLKGMMEYEEDFPVTRLRTRECVVRPFSQAVRVKLLRNWMCLSRKELSRSESP